MTCWWAENILTDGWNLEILKGKQLDCGGPGPSTRHKLLKEKILKEEIESKCRLCKEYEENMDHLTSGCLVLGKERIHNKT
jgi:hypothetical protein